MNHSKIALAVFSVVLFCTGCSVPHKRPVLHDFGPSVQASAYKGREGNNPAITVNAPTWLWDNRIRYRLLYASPTQLGFYALDLWIASPPELFEQLLISSGKTRKYTLNIQLQQFEQQFDSPDRARVVLRFSVEAKTEGNNKKAVIQEFYLERPTATPDAAGAVNAFVKLSQQAADRIQDWLAGLPDKPV